ncbi:Acyl-CoA N-acyltransferase [Penicillium riverlandense]|uniref:Acyl-CoA N-acyltransferase n=1 Tax=Penicillium riverlandense TaxID=1903569 RepID=UPI002546B998|nr:Acyl-CoA N-acyltransferase [Penicillium riverlandense]KAJ5815044.1 Acyl-CoA N-acyltransferase [Penicillium riverlandense]
MPIPTASHLDKETQANSTARPAGSAGYASLDTLSASGNNSSSGRQLGTGTGGTVSAPGSDSSQNAESERAMSKEEADRLYEERMEDEYAKREGGAWPKVPHTEIKQTEDYIASKTFTDPEASGATGRRFLFACIRADDPDQTVIGAVGINSLLPSPSVGFGMNPDFWGMGYASEAVGGLVEAWSNLERIVPRDTTTIGAGAEGEKLFAACNKENVGSMKVLLKNGFRVYDEVEAEGDTVVLFDMDMPRKENIWHCGVMGNLERSSSI